MPEWIGKTIGKVRIDKFLARGGMAEVYLGSHLTLDRPVAVKVLHSYIEEEPDLLARFHREAKVVAGLRHPNIVQIFDFDTTDGHPYIVMEFLRGPTLSTYLRRLHEHNERIPTHQVARLLKRLTAALDYAHAQGVIHRDIKPGNILLHSASGEIPLDQPLGNEVEGILTDFGLVRIAHATHQTASGLVSGTPAYMSPEQARGDKTDHRTDIYSLGIVLYEMLAGRVPFEAESSSAVIYKQINEPPPPITGAAPPVQAVINRALAKNPADRYQSSREMAVDFFLAIGMNAEAETIREALPGGLETLTEPKAPNRFGRRALAGAVIVLLLCLGLAAFGAYRVFTALPLIAATSEPVPPATDSAPAPEPTEAPALPSSEGMVEVPGGTYQVGLDPTDQYHIAPKDMPLESFWIDKFQTTNLQYQEFLEATGTAPPEIWPAEGNHPVRGVNWEDAAAYCAWRLKRLPSEAEWEAAGRGSGPNPQLYPWGDDVTAGGQTAALPDLDTYQVGTQFFNQSPNGVFDMVGNIWEWIGEPYTGLPAGHHILRGGRFGVPVHDLAYRLEFAPEETFLIQYAGFRCAADQVK